MNERTDALAPHALLEWLCACDSRDQILDVIRSWLRANPPRIIDPLLEEFAQLAARIVAESGPPGAATSFDAREWVIAWAHTPHPALGEQRPVHVIQTPEGVKQVRQLLEQSQSGAYA